MEAGIALWFSSGRIVWLIALILLMECGLLILIRNKFRWELPLDDFFASQFAGLGLALALRAALIQAPWTHVASWLFLAFVAHAAQLSLRWRQATKS